MSRGDAVLLLVLLLAVSFGGLYLAWRRKSTRHTSAAVVVEPTGPSTIADDTAAPSRVTGTRGEDSDREPGLQVAERQSEDEVQAEGTYVSTTTAASRLERVTVEGLGHPSQAVLLVHRRDAKHLVEIRRTGERDVLISADRLRAFRRDRGMAGKFMGPARLAVLTWTADDGAVYETGFLPRHRADLERIEAALWWHTAAREVQEPVARADSGVNAEEAVETPSVPAAEQDATSAEAQEAASAVEEGPTTPADEGPAADSPTEPAPGKSEDEA